jgi:hypothetical protein
MEYVVKEPSDPIKRTELMSSQLPFGQLIDRWSSILIIYKMKGIRLPSNQNDISQISVYIWL